MYINVLRLHIQGKGPPQTYFSNFESFCHIFQLLFSVHLDINLIPVYILLKKGPFLYQINAHGISVSNSRFKKPLTCIL